MKWVGVKELLFNSALVVDEEMRLRSIKRVFNYTYLIGMQADLSHKSLMDWHKAVDYLIK